MKRSVFYARKANGDLFTFQHHGREFRLFKRIDSAAAPYYVHFQMHGQRHKFGTRTNQRDSAVLLAKAEMDRVRDELLLDRYGYQRPEEHRGKVPTIGQVLEAWRSLSRGEKMSQRTAHEAEMMFRMVIRQGIEDPRLVPTPNPTAAERERVIAAVDALSMNVIGGANGGKVIRAFQRARLAGTSEHDERRRQSALTSLNSYVIAARMLFTAERLKAYRTEFKLALPDLTEFLEHKLPQATRASKPLPSRELMLATMAAVPALKQNDWPSYAVFLLAYTSGLRRGEIARCQRAWIQQKEIPQVDFTQPPVPQWGVQLPPETKGKRARWMPIPEWVATELLNAPDKPEGGFLIPAGPRPKINAALRLGAVFKRINAWMRGLGWNTGHTIHELRAYYLRLAREQHGPDVARELGGHRSFATTEQSYAGQKSLAGVVIQFPGMKVA